MIGPLIVATTLLLAADPESLWSYQFERVKAKEDCWVSGADSSSPKVTCETRRVGQRTWMRPFKTFRECEAHRQVLTGDFKNVSECIQVSR